MRKVKDGDGEQVKRVLATLFACDLLAFILNGWWWRAVWYVVLVPARARMHVHMTPEHETAEHAYGHVVHAQIPDKR